MDSIAVTFVVFGSLRGLTLSVCKRAPKAVTVTPLDTFGRLSVLAAIYVFS